MHDRFVFPVRADVVSSGSPAKGAPSPREAGRRPRGLLGRLVHSMGVNDRPRWALAAALLLVTSTAFAGDPKDGAPLAGTAAAPGAKGAPKGAAKPAAKADAAKKVEGAKADADKADAAKKDAPDDSSARGVVLIERAGQPLALGAVLANDGRVLTALSPLASGNDLDVRFADGTIVHAKLGHHDRMWDLALLVPQTGKWKDGLIASTRDPVRPDAALHTFSLTKGKIASTSIALRAHRTLLGGDDKKLEGAIEIGSRVNPVDLGSPIVDEDGRAVGVLARGCAPNDNRPCTPVAFGAPVQAIRAFLRSVPATAAQPAAWLGIQGIAEPDGVAKGVRVLLVHPESPADDAHLKGGDRTTGDVILAVDGTPVTTPESLADAIHTHGVGEKVPLMVLSEGKYRTVTVLLRAAPDAKAAPAAPANPAELPAGSEPGPAPSPTTAPKKPAR